MEINSTSNARVKQWLKYHEKKHREKDRRFLIEGEHLIQEAIYSGLLDTLILSKDCPYSFDFAGERIIVSDEILHKCKFGVSLPSCMGVCHYKTDELSLGKKVILLDDIQDPGNGGTIIRTAHSFGFDAVIFSKKSVDLYNDKMIRSSQGAFFHQRVFQMDLVEIIEMCRQQGFEVYATALKDSEGLSKVEPSEKVALIFGNEGAGVSEQILNMSDRRLFIEMSCFESLNVAIAAGICCYYFRKR